MARLPRLALPEHVHWIIQRGISGRAVFTDDEDRRSFLAALREAAAMEQVSVHAYALADSEVHLLVRPTSPPGLSRMMQALGRRYVSAHHRRHGGSGTLWDGRFRCAVVEPGATLLEVLRLIDGLAPASGHSALAHRSGGTSDPLVVDPPEYWSTGNTPFERQMHWRAAGAEGLAPSRTAALVAAARGGWVVGSPAFSAAVAEASGRPAAPRPRGRPAKQAA
jgi:putative transposase